MKRLYLLILILLLLVIPVGIYVLFFTKATFNQPVSTIEGVSASSLNDRIGVNGGLPSLTNNTARMATAATQISNLNMGWTRHEFHYSSGMYYGFYDNAKRAQDAKGIKTLGLLAYPGSGSSMAQWTTYVRSVVSHYGTSIPAWEIMNEADNYLSPADYANYLKEAHAIIKGINPNAIIVSTGLGSRPEAADFLDGLKNAGVWDKFDAVGMHLYHSGSPEQVNWGGGAVSSEVSRFVGAINRNGGGKKIWITEIGYQSGVVGEENQGKYLARAMIMARSFEEVEKIFTYRLYDNSDGSTWGLLNSGFTPKASFNHIKNAVSFLNGKGLAERVFTNYNILDPVYPVPSGWFTGDTKNASILLGGDWGVDGMALTMDYNFNMDAASAYTMAAKKMGPIYSPTTLAAWLKGDNSKNVWKFRFVDSANETFQIDFGSLSSNWQHIKFTVGRDPAMVSWGGDGVVNYPIYFLGVVIDRQGGQSAGEAWVDNIGYLPDVDTFAYRFGSSYAFWKQEGSGNFNLDNRTLNFSETPQYF